MEYLNTASTHESYVALAMAASKDETKVLVPYADYGSAMFGHRLVPRDVLEAPRDHEPTNRKDLTARRLEGRQRMNSAIEASPIIVWAKFGGPLSSSVSLSPSLEHLLSVFDSNPSFVPFRDGLLPALADYSRSGSGQCTIFSLSKESMRSSPMNLVGSTAGRWPNKVWWLTLGLPIPSSAGFGI